MVLYNNIWIGRLDIVKVDQDTRKPLANALFTLTGSDGSKQTLGTGGDGKVFFENLVYGVTYTWEETKAPHGYQLDENNTGTWTVGKHDDSITITCENQRRPGSISVLKQDSDGNPLSGCTFMLEYYNGSVWKPVVSRSDGVITKSIAEINAKILMLDQLQGKGYLAPEVYQSQVRDLKKQLGELKLQRQDAFESRISEMQRNVKHMISLLEEIEEPLEQFDERLFMEIVKEITINAKDEMTITVLGNLKFTELI